MGWTGVDNVHPTFAAGVPETDADPVNKGWFTPRCGAVRYAAETTQHAARCRTASGVNEP